MGSSHRGKKYADNVQVYQVGCKPFHMDVAQISSFEILDKKEQTYSWQFTLECIPPHLSSLVSDRIVQSMSPDVSPEVIESTFERNAASSKDFIDSMMVPLVILSH